MEQIRLTQEEIFILAEMYMTGEISKEDADLIKEVTGVELLGPLPDTRRNKKRSLREVVDLSSSVLPEGPPQNLQRVMPVHGMRGSEI
jgi:hypothetical protein